MAIISPFATPSSFTLQADGRTQTSYSGTISSTNPTDTEITAIEIGAQGIPETLYCKIQMSADWGNFGATGGFTVYLNNLKIASTGSLLGIGSLDPKLTLLIPAGAALKITTLNAVGSGNLERWITCTAWSLQRRSFRVI